MAKPNKNILAGMAVGAAAGLVGSWVMLQFIEGYGSRMLNDLKSEQDRSQDEQANAERVQAGKSLEPVTMQAANVFASSASGGRHLTRTEREKGGTLVHYVFGSLMGAAYGTVSEFTRVPGVGLGAVFATVLWAGTDLLSVPAVGFAKWPQDEPAAAHLTHWLAHMMYGTTMETTRRLLRFGSLKLNSTR